MPLAARWYTGLPDARGVHDLAWLHRSGRALTAEEWDNRTSRIIGALIGVPERSWRRHQARARMNRPVKGPWLQPARTGLGRRPDSTR